MATHSWMSAPTNLNGAFLTWVKGIHDALVAVGMVQTADTGQIDLVVPPTMVTNANTIYGYEIWRFNDPLQATAPIFFKIEYGGGYTSQAYVGAWFTVATGSDGAGNLTGNVLLPRQQLNAAASSQGYSETQYASYASGDGSCLNLVLWPSWPGGYALGGFCIERSRATNGQPTADAVAILLLGSSRKTVVTGAKGVHGSIESTVWDGQTSAPISFPRYVNGISNAQLTASLSEDGVVAPVLPFPLMAPGVTPFVANAFVAVHPGDAGATSVIQAATINGATRIYRAFPFVQSGSASALIPLGTNNEFCLPAILWEA